MATWNELLDAADKQIPGYRNLVLSAAEHAGAAVDWRHVESLLDQKFYGQAIDLVDASWKPIEGSFANQIKQRNLSALGDGAKIGMRDLRRFADVPEAVLGGVFDITSPLAVAWAGSRSSELIVGISGAQKDAVRAIITRATSGEFSAAKAARLIRGTVGLDPRRAAALASFASAAYAKATTAKQIAAATKSVDRYQRRLLARRAEVIARTELQAATHEGLQASWEAAKKQGLISRGMVKRWIVTPDDRLCPYCRKMRADGKTQQVPLDANFQTPLGPRKGPPMHPQCRCSMGLVRGMPTIGRTGEPVVRKPREDGAPVIRRPPRVKPTPTVPAPAPVPMPPADPPAIAKVKTLGVDAEGKIAMRPWAEYPYDDMLDSTLVDRAMTSPGSFLNPAHEIDPAEMRGLWRVTTDTRGVPLTHADLGDVQRAITASRDTPIGLVIRSGGREVYVGNEAELLAKWATESPAKVMRLDLDGWKNDVSPLGKLRRLKVDASGDVHGLPFRESFIRGPVERYGLTGPDLSDLAVRAADETVALADLKSVERIKADPLREALTKDLRGDIHVLRSGKDLFIASGDEVLAAAESLRGATTVRAKLVDVDRWLAERRPVLKVRGLGTETVSTSSGGVHVGVRLPPGMETRGLTEGIAPSMAKRLEGKALRTTTERVGLSDVAVAGPPESLTTEWYAARPTSPGSIRVRRVEGRLVAASEDDAARLVASWSRGETQIDVLIEEYDEAVAATRDKLKEYSARSAAKKAAKATSGDSALVPLGPPLHVDIDDLLTRRVGPQAGSNPGGLFEAANGERYYVKFYADADQAYGEHLAHRVYRALGHGAPESIVATTADGRTVYASRYLKGTRTVGSTGLDVKAAEQIVDGFLSDVLTANWDAVGSGLDNVVIDATGRVSRIDAGGTFFFRAKAGRKPTSVLDVLTEWEGFVGKNPDYARVFGQLGISSADDLGKRLIAQRKRLSTLLKDVDGFVADALPSVPAATRRAFVDMIETRGKLIEERVAAVEAMLRPLPVAGRSTTATATGDRYTAEQAAALMQRRVNAPNYAARRRAAEAEYKRAGVNVTQAMQKLQAHMDQAKVCINIETDNFKKVLTDGRFKSQFEVSHSGGSFNRDYRRQVEQQYFGVPGTLDPRERPIYGSFKSDPYRASGRWSGASSYGDVTVVLKDSIRHRASACYDDSFCFDGSSVTMPHLITRADPVMASTRGATSATSATKIEDWASSYFEIQYHGGVLVDDIAEVVFEYAPDASVIRALDARGIKWQVKK